MTSSKIIDYDFAIKCYSLCEEYGLDTVSIPRYIAFAIDLYEKGILTKEDTDGMHLEWGNQEVFLSLLDKIVRREGIGDVLANGVYRAAQQIGKGAEQYAYHTKKLEFSPSVPTSLYMPYFALCQSISDKVDSTRNMSYIAQYVFFDKKEGKEAYIKDGFFVYPKEFEEPFFAEFDYSGADYEQRLRFISYDEETFSLTDMMGLCNFWSLFYPYASINSRALMAELVSCVTGMDIDEAKLTEMARRTINLVRAYNVGAGINRKDDTVPEMFFQRTPAPPFQKLDRGLFNKWVDKFYEIRGWNSDGIPTKETLDELGLDYAKEGLEQRGILTD